MKYYSDLEKKTIELILTFNDKEQYNCLFNLLFDINDPVIGPITEVNIFHMKNDDSTIQFAEWFLQGKNARHIHMETISKLYSVVNLLKYLIKEGLVVFVENSKKTVFSNHPSEGFIIFDILDDNLKKDLFYFDTGYLLPTFSLYKLVENGFKSPEDAYKEQRQELQAEKFKEILKMVQDRADINQKEMEKETNKYKKLTTIISIIAIIAPLCVAIISLLSTQKVSLQPLPTISVHQSFIRLPFF